SCGREVVRETAEVVASQLRELPPGTRLLIGFDVPVVETTVPTAETPEVDELAEQPDVVEPEAVAPKASASAAARAATLAAPRKKGFGRLLIDGRAVGFDDVDAQSLRDRAMLQVVVDRVQMAGEASTGSSRAESSGDDLRQRLTDSIETAYLEGGGAAWAYQA